MRTCEDTHTVLRCATVIFHFLHQEFDPILLIIFVLLFAPCSSNSIRLCRFKSDRDEIWQVVLNVNRHRLTETDFWHDITISRWRPWLTSRRKCCHLVMADAASALRLLHHSCTRCCICCNVRRLTASNFVNSSWSTVHSRLIDR